MDANFSHDVDVKTTTYAALVSDNRTTLECNHATTPFTVTLGDAATMAAAETGDYEITISNIGAAAVTVARAGSDTIDGAATSIVLAQYDSVTLKVNAATDGYNSIARGFGGLLPTKAELAAMDADFTVTTPTVAADDAFVMDDADVGMTQVDIDNVDTYLAATTKTLTNKTLTSPVLNTGVSGTAVLDEDDMSSDSATQLATQQSIKAYADAILSSGTWTPTVQDSSASDAEGQTYTTQTGDYVAIGDMVFITGYLSVSSLGTLTGGQPCQIAGLPFTVASTGYGGAVTIGSASSLNITANQVVTGSFNAATDQFGLRLWDGTAGDGALTIDEFSAGGTIAFSGAYQKV